MYYCVYGLWHNRSAAARVKHIKKFPDLQYFPHLIHFSFSYFRFFFSAFHISAYVHHSSHTFARIADNVDRWHGKCSNNGHRLHERAAIWFAPRYSKINSEADAEKASSQHDIHVSSTEYSWSDVPCGQTEIGGKIVTNIVRCQNFTILWNFREFFQFEFHF